MARYAAFHRWWRPLLGTLMLVCGSVLVTVFFYILADELGRAAGYPELPDGDVDFGPVLGTALDLAFIALDLPLVLLAVRWVGGRPAGTVSSVAGRPRWRWLAWCLLAAVPAMVLLPVVAIFLPEEQGGAGAAGVWVGWQTFLLSLAMLVALVPLQAAAEEYVFRGWLLQAAGSFVRSPLVAVLPQAVLFAAAHGWGTAWGFTDLVFFGLAAGWLTIRTGGLEASIALHVMNNLLAFGLSAAFADGLASDETAADAPWQLALADMSAVLLYAAIVLWLARRRSPLNVSPPVPAPAAPYLPYPQAPGPYGPSAPPQGLYRSYVQPQGPYGPYPQSQSTYGQYGTPPWDPDVPDAGGPGAREQPPHQPGGPQDS
ncbi:hypothetical protein GCM10020367_05520 [Streptomyces sannanensis]|uniref:CAAX prenyl protease 2/Lysostaphin resistance protein A-like domain-containing protein n=2 Tax=Streptomyces sannanensis TaxID=285536 RepID=A0ABP6S4P2_9ACTN